MYQSFLCFYLDTILFFVSLWQFLDEIVNEKNLAYGSKSHS